MDFVYGFLVLLAIPILIELAKLPFVVASEWFGFIKRQQPLDAELTKASHGVVMVMASIWLMWLVATRDGFEYRNIALLLLAFVATWGAFWVVIGAARSRYYKDHRLLGRAIAKIAVAALIVYLMPHEGWLFVVECVVAGWCAVTGVTKAVLMLLPPPQLPDDPDDMPDDDFGSTHGLR